MRSGLQVGQVPTRLALAYYSVNSTGSFYPRITRPLQGAAGLVHCKGADCARWCAASAAAAAGPAYQLLIPSKTEEQRVRVLRGSRACAAALGTRCPFAGDYKSGGAARPTRTAPARPPAGKRPGTTEVFRPTLKSAVDFDLAREMKW